MKLIEYRVRHDQELIDAVFEASDGKFWHVQRVGPRKISRETPKPKVVFAELTEPPVLDGRRADSHLPDPQQVELTESTRWYQLVLSLLRLDSGWQAFAATFTLA